MGIATASSHNASTPGVIPCPSPPKTMQQSLVKSASANVRPSTCGWAAMQRIPRSLRLDKHLIKFGVSIIGNSNTVPIELRTARRRKGLLEVSPTISPHVPSSGQEYPLLPVRHLPPHRSIRLQLRQLKRSDVFDCKHGLVIVIS